MNAIPKGLKALVVDDHDLIRKTVSRVLRKLSFADVMECSNGKDARIIIETKRPHLIICDIELNIISGFELLDLVRGMDTGADTPFIILSGTAEKSDIIKAIDKGADEYIVMPFQPEELESKATKVLNQFYSPGPMLARLRAAEQEVNDGKWSNAKALIEEVLKIKDSPRARHLDAILSIKQKMTEEAIGKLEDNIRNSPSYLKNYATLANLYIENKDYPRAIHALRQELEINPKQPLRQIKLANMLLKEKSVSLAIEHYRIALLENARNPEALYGMGTAYAMMNNMEKALYYFKRYRRNHPKDTRSLKAVIQFCEQSNQLRLAEITLLDEKKNHPDRMDTYQLLAEFYQKHNKPDEAQLTLQAAIKRKPDFISAYVMLANHFLAEKNIEAAIDCFRALMQASRDPNVVEYLAQLYIKTGKYSQAISTMHDSMQSKADPRRILPQLFTATLKTQQIYKAFLIKQRLDQLEGRPNQNDAKDALTEQIQVRRNSKNINKLVS